MIKNIKNNIYMKNIICYIKEQLNNKLINEAYESKAIQQMMNKLHDLNSRNSDLHGINIYSKILKQPYFLSESQAARHAHLSKWKDEWFLEKNGKQLFDKKEFLSLIGVNENTKLDDINFFDIATKKSSCFFILGTRNYNKGYLDDIECALIMDPKAGWDVAKLLKKIRNIDKDRLENSYSDTSSKYKDIVNKEVKEYYKKASDEQKELLTNATNTLLKYTGAGQNIKKSSIEDKNSKEYTRLRAKIMRNLINGDHDHILNNLIEWTDNYDNKQKNKIKDYITDVVNKLKIDK